MDKLIIKNFFTNLGIRFGTTRMVFFLGKYAIKLPKINNWKFFLKGIIANLDENMWYKHSPHEWQLKMAPSLYCWLGGLILISLKAEPITDKQFNQLDRQFYNPLPVDFKADNFGLFQNRIVLVDYADSRYWCSDCELFFCKRNC